MITDILQTLQYLSWTCTQTGRVLGVLGCCACFIKFQSGLGRTSREWMQSWPQRHSLPAMVDPTLRQRHHSQQSHHCCCWSFCQHCNCGSLLICGAPVCAKPPVPNMTWASCTMSWECILSLPFQTLMPAVLGHATPAGSQNHGCCDKPPNEEENKSETTLRPQLSSPSIWQGAPWRSPLRMRRPVNSSTSTVHVQKGQSTSRNLFSEIYFVHISSSSHSVFMWKLQKYNRLFTFNGSRRKHIKYKNILHNMTAMCAVEA